MNCKEAIDLAEEALDKDLPRAVKHRLDLHLSRCESCRRLFEAERNEHVRWFRIFNDPAAMRSLPSGFADRLAASARLARPGFWFRIPRWAKIAASLLALASFISFAAVVVVGRGVLDAPESADGEEMAGRVVPNAPDSLFSGNQQSATDSQLLHSQLPSATYQLPSTDNQLTSSNYQLNANIGEIEMNIKKKASAVLVASMVSMTAIFSSRIT